MQIKRLLLTTGLCAALSLSVACSEKEPDAGTDGTGGDTTKQDNTPPVKVEASDWNKLSPEQLAKARSSADKGWAWLDANYNQPVGDMMKGEIGTWGPKCDPAFSCFALLAGLKTGYLKPSDPRVAATLADSIFKAQAAYDESHPYWLIKSPAMGQSLYITSVGVSLLSWLRDNAEGQLPKALYDQLNERIDGAVNFLAASQIGVPGQNSSAVDVPGAFDELAAKNSADSSVYHGGWAYGVDNDKSRGDARLANLSTSSFALDALAAEGRLKAGDPILEAAKTFLKRTQNDAEGTDMPRTTRISEAEGHPDTGEVVVKASSDSPHFGGAPYSPTESKAGAEPAGDGEVVLRSYGSMTYTMLRGFLHVGLTDKDPAVKHALTWLTNNFSVERVPGFINTEEAPNNDQMALYYQYLQIARTFNMMDMETFRSAGGVEHQWRSEIVDALATRQKSDGSWANINPRWQEGAPILATCYVMNAFADIIPAKE